MLSKWLFLRAESAKENLSLSIRRIKVRLLIIRKNFFAIEMNRSVHFLCFFLLLSHKRARLFSCRCCCCFIQMRSQTCDHFAVACSLTGCSSWQPSSLYIYVWSFLVFLFLFHWIFLSFLCDCVCLTNSWDSEFIGHLDNYQQQFCFVCCCCSQTTMEQHTFICCAPKSMQLRVEFSLICKRC